MDKRLIDLWNKDFVDIKSKLNRIHTDITIIKFLLILILLLTVITGYTA